MYEIIMMIIGVSCAMGAALLFYGKAFMEYIKRTRKRKKYDELVDELSKLPTNMKKYEAEVSANTTINDEIDKIKNIEIDNKDHPYEQSKGILTFNIHQDIVNIKASSIIRFSINPPLYRHPTKTQFVYGEVIEKYKEPSTKYLYDEIYRDQFEQLFEYRRELGKSEKDNLPDGYYFDRQFTYKLDSYKVATGHKLMPTTFELALVSGETIDVEVSPEYVTSLYDYLMQNI